MMAIRTVVAVTLAWTVLGCATMRDTIEGRQPGTSRLVAVPHDTVWDAAVEVIDRQPVAEADKTRGLLVTEWVERLVEPTTFNEQQILKRSRFFAVGRQLFCSLARG